MKRHWEDLDWFDKSLVIISIFAAIIAIIVMWVLCDAFITTPFTFFLIAHRLGHPERDYIFVRNYIPMDSLIEYEGMLYEVWDIDPIIEELPIEPGLGPLTEEEFRYLNEISEDPW
jgi:hypothetical protein